MKRNRRSRSYPQRHGPIHASNGIAHTLAAFYFRLAGGNAKQQAAAQDFKSMVLGMGKGGAS